MTQQEVTGTPASCRTAGEDVGKNATYESNLLACSCVLITADDPWPAEYPKLTKKVTRILINPAAAFLLSR